LIVALDATYSLGRELTGIGIYSAKIIEALVRQAPDAHFLLTYRSHRFLRALATPRPAANCSRRLLAEPLCFFSRHRVSVFHGLNQRLPRCQFPRTVTTFHDLFVFTADYSSPEFRRRFVALARDAANRSDHIIAVSQFTAEEIVRHLHYPQEQITVIHHGVDPIPEFSAEELQRFRRQHALEKPFFLNVGVLDRRKNVRRLVEAFERIPSDCLLVLAGGVGYGSEEIQEKIHASPARARIRVLGHASRSLLARLYRTASALVFPSLDEGFGMPVLEAMTASLPVVTSNRSALPEVVGDAALLVDPEQTDDIQRALERIVSESDLRSRLMQAGLKRARSFTWEKAATATLGTYRYP
jgi:glycosyltransferase involved in cell wall biosynthesis